MAALITCAHCSKEHRADKASRRFCSHACYSQYRSYTFRGAAHPNFKGRVAHHSGYIRIYEPKHPLAHADGYVLEHRKVVYDAGIDVPEGSHVHHLNGDKSDNWLGNLSVLTESDHHLLHVAQAGAVENQFGVFPLRRSA